MENGLYLLVNKLLSKNKIYIQKEEVKLQIGSHPSYPSLHAIVGVLNHFNIPSLAVKLPITEEVFSQLPISFLAMIQNPNESLVLAEKKNKLIKITYQNGKRERLTPVQFLSLWNGILIAIEKDENTKEDQKKISGELNWVVGVLLVLAGVYLLKGVSLFEKVYTSLSALGVLVSYFIVKQGLGLQNTTTNSLCNFSEKISCNAVLESSGARILGMLTLSEASIAYFLSLVIGAIVFELLGLPFASVFPWMSILTVPVLGYSLYYQKFVVKKWCPLCLGIIAILTFQIAWVLIFKPTEKVFNWNPQSLLFFLVLSFIISRVTMSILLFIKKKIELKNVKKDYLKFKNNFALFKALYNQQEKLKANYPIPGEIVFGNKNAPLEIILVTSPFCHYCKQAHKDLQQIMHLAKRDIKVTFRFLADPLQKESDLYKVVSQLLYIYHTQGEAETLLALDTLYGDTSNPSQWIPSMKLIPHQKYDGIMELQKGWAQENNINFTPAFYLNGKEYPKEYNRTDVLTFIEDFKESLLTEKEKIFVAPSVA
ncbi:MAG: vitamin K epoxide reductase family protein [Flavobacteriaceae bacterium]